VKYSGLVRSRVNLHGELHLDKEFTKLLIGMLEHLERAVEQQTELLQEGMELLQTIKEKYGTP
jgi:hypothetical protein